MRLLLLSLCSLLVYAQSSLEVSGSGGAARFAGAPLGYMGFISNNTPVGRVEFHPAWQLGGRVTYNQSRWFGHEIGLSYGQHTLTHEIGTEAVGEVRTNRSFTMGFYDLLVYATPDEAKVRPFAAGGFGVTYFMARTVALQMSAPHDVTKFALNFGGGVKIAATDNVFVRLDVRDYASSKPFRLIAQEGWLHQVEVSAGIGLRF